MNRRGFTLIELLVVIAIIAILAAILFPVFANAKERGRQAKCCGNLKQLTQAMRQYCDDHNGVMPSGSAKKSADLSGKRMEWTGSQWAASYPVDLTKGQIWKWVRTKQIYVCPTDAGVPAAGIHYTPTGGAYSGPKPKDFPFSYSMNEEMCSIYGSSGNDGFKNNLRLDPETAGRSGKVLLLIHENRKNPKITDSGINDGYFSWRTSYNDLPSKIHYDGTTCSYVDGHVKWIGYDRLLEESDAAHADQGNPWSEWLSNTRIGQIRH